MDERDGFAADHFDFLWGSRQLDSLGDLSMKSGVAVPGQADQERVEEEVEQQTKDGHCVARARTAATSSPTGPAPMTTALVAFLVSACNFF